MKYKCVKCGDERFKKLAEKTYKKKMSNGKIIKVPACNKCGIKMEPME